VSSPTRQSRTQSVFNSKFQALVVRRGGKRATIAIGQRILRTIYSILKRAQYYRDSTADHEALSGQKNAPRWITVLVSFGYIDPPSRA